MPRLSDLLNESSEKNKLFDLVSEGKLKRAARNRKPSKHHKKRFPVSDFVALDFETTGLESKDDRIIEIGAVRFHNGSVQEEFSSLVNPCKPIPKAIVELTGITDADVKDAPLFEDVAHRLLTFLDTLPLCGHQVEFDIGFLNEELKRLGRPRISNQSIDTALISRIILPRLAGYSLGHVARSIEQVLESAHRALDDARASGMVAVELLSRLEELSPDVRQQMASFAPASLFKKILIQSVGKKRDLSSRTFSMLPKPPKRLAFPEEFVSLEIAEVQANFSIDGPLVSSMPGFSPRSSQTKMAEKVAEALNTESFLVAEAGTGTGKSLAYLLPAALFALKNDCRIFISTYTKNLQDQLVSKDIPQVGSLLGDGLKYTVLKGRSNYLCRNRFSKLLAGRLGNLSPRERSGVLPLIRWAEETVNGDIEEQSQFSRRSFSKIWNLISADSQQCRGRSCSMFSNCFLQNARQKALGSHLVVINHALFFSEICAEATFLGKIGPMIFDEAHHLQDSGYQHLRTEVDTNRINRYLELLTNLQKKIEKSQVPESFQKLGKTLKKTLKRLRKEASEAQSELDRWVTRQDEDQVQYQFAYRDEPFEKLSSVGSFEFALTEIQDVLGDLKQLCIQTIDEKGIKELESEVASAAERTSQFKADYAYLRAAVTEGHVFWIEGNHNRGWVKLCGVPLDIGEILGGVWAANECGLVFTSATLSVNGAFDHFLPKLGLVGELAERTFSEVFPTPFHASQALNISAVQAPEPDTQDYTVYLAEMIAQMHRKLRKNTLVLFTSHVMLRNVYSLLRAMPGIDKTNLLAQNITGNRHVILGEFKKMRGAILLGADSFWEGVDAPGEACEIVVIARLPFPVPTHPLVRAIGKKFESECGESFFSYSIPEAIVRFRQGAGRLIRSKMDRGALVVLDKRIVTKPYGKKFVRSLHGELQVVQNGEQLLQELETYFQTMYG